MAIIAITTSNSIKVNASPRNFVTEIFIEIVRAVILVEQLDKSKHTDLGGENPQKLMLAH